MRSDVLRHDLSIECGELVWHQFDLSNFERIQS